VSAERAEVLARSCNCLVGPPGTTGSNPSWGGAMPRGHVDTARRRTRIRRLAQRLLFGNIAGKAMPIYCCGVEPYS
jgi:hypothetical protein